MGYLRWLRSVWWLLGVFLYPALVGAATYRLSFVPPGGQVEIAQEAKLTDIGMLLEEDPREIYRWLADKAKEKGQAFPFAAWLKACAEGKKEQCPAKTPWVKLILRYEGKDVVAHWPIESKQAYFFDAIFKHPESWHLAGMLLRLGRWEARGAFRLLQALESYAERLGEKKSRDVAYLAAESFAVRRSAPDSKFYYYLEANLPKLQEERGGKASAFVAALRHEVYIKARFDLMAHLEGHRVGRGLSELLYGLTATADRCEGRKGEKFACHEEEALSLLRRWVLRSAYHTAYSKGDLEKRKLWLAHAGHIFDRSEEKKDGGRDFTLDQLLDESDPNERRQKILQEEGIEDPAAYRRMVLEVIGRLKISDPYQRRRAYRRLLPLAETRFLRTEVGLALRSIFHFEDQKKRSEVFDILWQEGQEGRREWAFAAWADTFLADPQRGWVEAYHAKPGFSQEIHRAYYALRQASPEERKTEEKAWKLLIVAAVARLEGGDDLRDPAILPQGRQAALLQAALRYAYKESCIEGKPTCKGAMYSIGGRLIRHLTSWRPIPLVQNEARKEEIRRHFSNLTPMFKSLASVDERLLRRHVWLLEKLLPSWSLYRSAISLEERHKEWLLRVIGAFQEAKASLDKGLKNPKHRVWGRFRSLSHLAGAMGLIEDCGGEGLTETLKTFNQEMKQKFQLQKENGAALFPHREWGLAALGRIYGDKARHCKMDGEFESRVAAIKVLLDEGEDQAQAVENRSRLHLNLALGGIGQAKTPASSEGLKSLFGIDKIGKAYSKEQGWIFLWGQLSLEKDLPCAEVEEKLKVGEEAKWKAFEVLRDILWLQAQGLCIHRRQLFSTILPLSERSRSALVSAQNLEAAKTAILRRVQKASLAKDWRRDFEALVQEALRLEGTTEEDAAQGKEQELTAADFSVRWRVLQERLMDLLKEKEADWPTEEKRLVSQGAVLASSYLSHLYEAVQLQRRQKEADRVGGLRVPSIHPLRYISDSKTEEDIKTIEDLVGKRNQKIREDLTSVVEKKQEFFNRRSEERQRIYNRLQRAYLELGDVRLEAQKLGLEAEIFELRRAIAHKLRAIARIDIEVAEKHQKVATLRKSRAKQEKELRAEGVDLSKLEIRIKELEEDLIESEIEGREKETKIVQAQEKCADEIVKLSRVRLQQIEGKIKAIEARNQTIDTKLKGFAGIFAGLDGKLAQIEEKIKKQGEKEELIRQKAGILAEKKGKIEAQFALLEEKGTHLKRKLGVLHEQKKKILERNHKIAKLWQTRIKETELALATLGTEIQARKAVIKLSIQISADIIKKTDANIAQVLAAKAEHERRRRKSFWSRVASIGFRIVGAVVGTICCGNPMLGLQIGGLVGDFIAKGAIEGDWGGAWKGLGIGAATMLLTAGMGGVGVGAHLASGISNVAIRAGVEQLANVAVESLLRNAIQGLETGQFRNVLENTLKDVVQDLPQVALSAAVKIDTKGGLGKAMEAVKFAHEQVLAGDLRNIKKLGDPAFLQERALALGEGFAKKALAKHAPDLMKAVQKFEDLQSKYNLFPKAQDIFKDGFTAFERHLKQRAEELPQELFQKHLQPKAEEILRRYAPKAIKDIESALRGKLGIEPSEIVKALKNRDLDILRRKFEDKLPDIQEAVVGGLKKHWGREIQQLQGLKANAEATVDRVKSKVEGVEQEFRNRLSQSLDQIQSFGHSVQGDIDRVLRHIRPEAMIETLRRDLTANLPQLSPEHLEGFLQYQTQRYAELTTRFHQLRQSAEWKGKEEYLRFVLLGRTKAKKLLADRIVKARDFAQRTAEGARKQAKRVAELRKLQQQAQAVQSVAQQYALKFRADRKLKWANVEGEIKKKLSEVFQDAVELQQQVKILEAQIDPAKMTRIVSAKLEPFQRLLKEGGDRASAVCNHGFDPCLGALGAYKVEVHEKAVQFQAQIEAELDDKRKELHQTQVKKYKEELEKESARLEGLIRVQDNEIKAHGTRADVKQVDIDEKKTEERLKSAEAEAKQSEIQAKSAGIEIVKSSIRLSETGIEKKRFQIEQIQGQIQKQEGAISLLDAEIQKTDGALSLEKAKVGYLGFQRELQKSKWMREVLMLRKQQGIYTSEAVKIRKAQAEKSLEQGKLLEQEAEIRLKEAGTLLKREKLKEEIAKKQIQEADIRKKIEEIRQEQQRLREAQLWLKIHSLEAAMRSVDLGVFPALRDGLLSPGWALQELQQLQNASLERLSLSLAMIFQAFEFSGVAIPKECKEEYQDKGFEKLPDYLRSCFKALRQNLAFTSVSFSCVDLWIDPKNPDSLVADPSKILDAFFSDKGGTLTFWLQPSMFDKADRLSLFRADLWVDLVKLGERSRKLPSRVSVQATLEQPALGSVQSPKKALPLKLRMLRSPSDDSDPSDTSCEHSIRAEEQENQKTLMYFNPVMRWTLRLRPTPRERHILKGFRPVRMRLNLVYRQPNLEDR